MTSTWSRTSPLLRKKWEKGWLSVLMIK
jgi:hypothetical protein